MPQTVASGWEQLCLCCKNAQYLYKLEIEVMHGNCIWVLNSLALEAVPTSLENRFHENPKAQACTRCPVACQQHSYSLEDIFFFMRVDVPKLYYTFSRVEHAFFSIPVEALLWIIFFNFSVIPKLSMDGIVLIAIQGKPLVLIQLVSPDKFPNFLVLSCFLQGNIPIWNVSSVLVHWDSFDKIWSVQYNLRCVGSWCSFFLVWFIYLLPSISIGSQWSFPVSSVSSEPITVNMLICSLRWSWQKRN